ncbi:signal peptidase I [Paenibacillus turpanensis]|uniref:signal peptidase I n=1 Tax=Paenibacillus turpanensis TaxID=2689078 RepID=UPI00140CAE8E|nr:signal peptidase I [Paenibacillus turpanensis]
MEQEQSGQYSQQAAEVKPGWKEEVIDWVKALLIAAVLVVVIRVFLFSPYLVDGPSMEPNFHTGERVIVNKILYDIREPEHGEVIVFEAPDGSDYIKRVIGLPGDTVRVDGDAVFVNGEKIAEPYIQSVIDEYAKLGNGNTYNNKNYDEHIVPENQLFVMGDNRRNSRDSRDIGFIEYEKVIGRADVRIWPLSQIGFVAH